MIKLSVNGTAHQVDTEPETPLLWVVREQIGLTGTRFGCGIGMCGSCTVHVDGRPVRSCILPVAAVVGSEVRTIEGLEDHPVQAAWLAEQVPQCGWCQSGQIMAAAALVETNRAPTDQDIDQHMTNLCRCGTYDRIRRGVKLAAEMMGPLPPPPVEEAEVDLPDGEPAVEGGQ